jgi:Spy/CpxP family protein refolding chaperone
MKRVRDDIPARDLYIPLHGFTPRRPEIAGRRGKVASFRLDEAGQPTGTAHKELIMNKTVATAVTAALLAGGLTIAMADGKRPEYGEGMRHGCEHGYGMHGTGHQGRGHDGAVFDVERRAEHMTRALSLDEKQTEKVKAIAKTYDKQFDELRGKMQDGRKQMHALMAKDDASEAEVRKLAEAQGKLKADSIMLRTKMQHEVDQVLTKEQREKHREMREHHGRHMS